MQYHSFSQYMGLSPGRSWFYNFCIFRIFCFKHFWKYLKNSWFSGKSYENMICSKFTQLSGKLWIVNISCVLPALCSKKPVSFFCISLYTVFFENGNITERGWVILGTIARFICYKEDLCSNWVCQCLGSSTLWKVQSRLQTWFRTLRRNYCLTKVKALAISFEVFFKPTRRG